MPDSLAEDLPLHTFPRETSAESAVLHHFGLINAAADSLDRPIWVSDVYDDALPYKTFGTPTHYTQLVTGTQFAIVDLNDVSLQQIAAKHGVSSHSDWNRRLGHYLDENNVTGIVYCGREIFLSQPQLVIATMKSTII